MLVISLVDGFVSERPFTSVVSTVVIVDFPHHILDFFWPEAPQIGIVMQPEI